jgi:hypothetical protein
LIRSCDGGEDTTDDCPILGALDHSLQGTGRDSV